MSSYSKLSKISLVSFNLFFRVDRCLNIATCFSPRSSSAARWSHLLHHVSRYSNTSEHQCNTWKFIASNKSLGTSLQKLAGCFGHELFIWPRQPKRNIKALIAGLQAPLSRKWWLSGSSAQKPWMLWHLCRFSCSSKNMQGLVQLVLQRKRHIWRVFNIEDTYRRHIWNQWRQLAAPGLWKRWDSSCLHLENLFILDIKKWIWEHLHVLSLQLPDDTLNKWHAKLPRVLSL